MGQAGGGKIKGFLSGSDGKESACNSGDLGLIPGSGRSPGGGHDNHSSILAWGIPWTEEPGGLQSMRSQDRHDWVTSAYLHMYRAKCEHKHRIPQMQEHWQVHHVLSS